MAAMSDQSPVDAERFLRVSDGLREAFGRLTGADVDDASRARWQRRLIAITNAAKHDLATAERRLAAYHADWEHQVGTGGSQADDL